VLHPGLGKEYVLKLARRPMIADPDGRDRLGREARLLAKCDHPNLVRVVDLDVDGDRPFVVMEYVPGLTLDQFAEQNQPGPRQSAKLVAELAGAAAYLHGLGIIHQDIKPRNVLVDDRGRPRLIDLGLARLRHAWLEDPPDWSGGTLAYMSPEQALGRPDRVGPCTDVFGLGGLLYYLLTGLPLYQGLTRASILGQARKAEYVPIRQLAPGVPRSIERICQKALALDPKLRYRTAGDLDRALRRFRSRPRAIFVGSVVLALAAVTLLATRPRLDWSVTAAGRIGTSAEATTPMVTQPAPSVADPVRITDFQVILFRQETSLTEKGMIGISRDEPRCDDRVRIRVRLSTPAYCYLIAFNSNGKVQPCYPVKADAQPPRADELWFPTGLTQHFALTDGPGLQAFVALASRKRLPPYTKWSAGVHWPWKHVIADGVWHYDGRWISPVSSVSRGDVTTDSNISQAFQDLCEFLSKLPGIESSQAIAFPIKPKA
jgi:Protein kinase domain/Domain of unknown function (DUF4384)